MLNLCNFYVCRNIKRNLDSWLSSFFPLLPANTKRCKYSLYTGVYSGWIAQYCAAPLFWWLRTGFSEQRNQSELTSPQGSDFSAPWKLQPLSLLGQVGIALAVMGRLLSHKFQGPLTPVVLILLTPTQTPVWRHHSKLDSAFVQNRNSSPGSSDCWHQNRVSGGKGLVWSSGLTGRLGYLETRKVGMAKPNEKTEGIAWYVIHSFHFLQMPSDNCLRKAATEPGLGGGDS